VQIEGLQAQNAAQQHELQRLAQQSQQLLELQAGAVEQLILNPKSPPFEDKEFRRILHYPLNF
jgi:hypothetical protein